jgi:hypothetical protein
MSELHINVVRRGTDVLAVAFVHGGEVAAELREGDCSLELRLSDGMVISLGPDRYGEYVLMFVLREGAG